MIYKTVFTEQAEKMLDCIVNYLLNTLENVQAANHFLNETNNLIQRLEDNPYQFPVCKDTFLFKKGYREALINKMNYIIIFKIENELVYILGIFHQLENYKVYL